MGGSQFFWSTPEYFGCFPHRSPCSWISGWWLNTFPEVDFSRGAWKSFTAPRIQYGHLSIPKLERNIPDYNRHVGGCFVIFCSLASRMTMFWSALGSSTFTSWWRQEVARQGSDVSDAADAPPQSRRSSRCRCDLCQTWYVGCKCCSSDIPSLKPAACTWKRMVGRLVSIWEGLFSATMLVLRRVFLIEMFAKLCAPCYALLCFSCFLFWGVGFSLLHCFFGCNASDLFYVWIGSIVVCTMHSSRTYITLISSFSSEGSFLICHVFFFLKLFTGILWQWYTWSKNKKATIYTPPKTSMDTVLSK